MSKEKTSAFGNALLWFGAAVSIAEILTGALIAPLGFGKGLLAIILGHIIGCIPLYFAGLIGAKSGKPAMETVGISFGNKGLYMFSALNILQLVGWTAVMIIVGAKAMQVVTSSWFSFDGTLFWCAVIGVLIALWILVGVKNLGKINIFAVGALFILTIVMGIVVFSGGGSGILSGGGLSFGAAVELSVAMPLSWLPLISDYTRFAKHPKKATAASVLAYFLGSCLMYTIGLGAALFTGNSDIAQILLAAGLGIIGIIVVILSTVTTTFLDAYSAGVSFQSIFSRFGEKNAAIAVTLIGTIVAMFTPIEQYQDFLYLIGSIFAPMTAILLTDYFILHRHEAKGMFDISNLILWLFGFLLYRAIMGFNTVIGNTLPVMIIIIAVRVIIFKITCKNNKTEE